jgi:hypothetical protein
MSNDRCPVSIVSASVARSWPWPFTRSPMHQRFVLSCMARVLMLFRST